ncbi:MAG: transporter [Gemmatimonadales bacterium]
MSANGVRWGLAATLLAAPVGAQELEPRALSNAPVGTSFVVVATGYSRGNLLFDPAVPIEDARADVWSVAGGFVRVIDVWGLSGKIGLVIPFVRGTWEGTVSGTDTGTARTGFADPRVQVAVNFIGAPALTLTEFREHRQTTVVGAQLTVSVPVGQYYPEKLINLGSNRWAFHPRLGVSRVVGRRWTLEAYASAGLYTTNGDYFGGQVFEQDPFFDVSVHGIYVIRVPDIWMAGSAGYGWGGAATIDGQPKDALENVRASLALRFPLARGHGLKLVYINGLTTSQGGDFDTFQIAYQYTFGGRR